VLRTAPQGEVLFLTFLILRSPPLREARRRGVSKDEEIYADAKIGCAIKSSPPITARLLWKYHL
jgi:hypothetical protein